MTPAGENYLTKEFCGFIQSNDNMIYLRMATWC